MKKSTPPVLWVGSTETCPDIRHITGFGAPDSLIVLKDGKRIDALVSKLEYGRALKQMKREVSVWTAERVGAKTGDGLLDLLKRRKCSRVTVPGDFPVSVAERLRKAKIRVMVSTESVNPGRMIKDKKEIAQIEVSQKAAKAGVRVAESVLRHSGVDARGRLVFRGSVLTSERLREMIRAEALKRGCLDEGTIVAGGRQGANPHERGSGALRTHEWIVVDVFPRHLEAGYFGDITRTLMKGRPTAKQRAMYRAVAKAQKVALGMIRPGATCKDVHAAVVTVFEAAGFKTEMRKGVHVGFFHGTGHGVGLEIHEAPSLSPKSTTTLKEGMVVTVEPGLYYPDLGGVRIEDTVMVTRTGCRTL